MQAVADALDQVPVGSPRHFTCQPNADIPGLEEAFTLLAVQIPQATAMKAGTVNVEDGQEHIRGGIVELLGKKIHLAIAKFSQILTIDCRPERLADSRSRSSA